MEFCSVMIFLKPASQPPRFTSLYLVRYLMAL